MAKCWWGTFSRRSLEEFGRFIVEQCAIFRGKMSTDKIFLGCREHEINLQDLGRTPSGPPGGGRGGGVGRQCEAWGVSCRAPPICPRVGKLFLFWIGFAFFAFTLPYHGHWVWLRAMPLNLSLKTGILLTPPGGQISKQIVHSVHGTNSMISFTKLNKY